MRVPTFAVPAIDALAGVLYPPRCFLCLGPIASPRDAVCPVCRGSMRRIESSHPLVAEGTLRLRAGGGIDGFLGLYLFEKRGPIQAALHQLKYSGMHSLGVWFGRDLGGAIAADPDLSAAGLLVPVPLHQARLRERGYNQAERICTGIAAMTRMPVVTAALVRSRNTPSQTALTVSERGKNVQGEFRIVRGKEGAVRGRTVLLVDDVLTTGSTMIACAHALRGAGAQSVLAATVAVADHAT